MEGMEKKDGEKKKYILPPAGKNSRFLPHWTASFDLNAHTRTAVLEPKAEAAGGGCRGCSGGKKRGSDFYKNVFLFLVVSSNKKKTARYR